jgi:CheY-like chemotaxis protein
LAPLLPAYGDAAVPHSFPPAMNNAPPTILAVDDDPNDLMFLEAAFKFIGVSSNIQTVSGGEEAVAYLNGDGDFADRARYPYPDVIVTDLKMPGLDGFMVLEFLRKKPESAVIRTVVLSGSQDNDDIKKAYWLGASGYVVKPSSPAELRKVVKTLHDYWLLCERPYRNGPSEQRPMAGCHKLGARATAGIFDSSSGEGQ